MDKIYGTTIRQDGLQKIGRGKWLLLYGLYGEEGSTYEYRHVFDHKPTLDEIKQIIVSQINTDVEEKIVNGFEWEGIKVYFSKENQSNFKAVYDLAVQTQGDTLPVRLKLSENAEGEAIYHTFETLDDFHDFYAAAINHLTKCLEEGWAEKDSIDWKVFCE